MITLHIVPGSRTWKAVTEAIPSDLLEQHVQVVHTFKDTKPAHAHLVLVAGTATPSKEIERFAARMGAYPVCIPEAGEWLTSQIRTRLDLNLSMVLVDSTLATTEQLSGAR